MRALSAQHFLPGKGHHIELAVIEFLGKGCRRGVANSQSFALCRDEPAIGNPYAGSRAIPGEDHIAAEIHIGKIGQFAIGRFENPHIGQLQLLGDIGDPALAKTLPGKHVDAALAQKRPQCHLHGAGVGRRHDAYPVAFGNLKNLARQPDGLGKLGLAFLGAVRAAQQGVVERFRRPARALGAGSG